MGGPHCTIIYRKTLLDWGENSPVAETYYAAVHLPVRHCRKVHWEPRKSQGLVNCKAGDLQQLESSTLSENWTMWVKK